MSSQSQPISDALRATTESTEPSAARHSWLARRFFGLIPLAVSDCLRDEADEWSGDDFRLVHRRRQLTVWIANGAYGIEVRGAGLTWGGVTGLSAFGLSPGHSLLRRAADKWAAARVLGPTAHDTAERPAMPREEQSQ